MRPDVLTDALDLVARPLRGLSGLARLLIGMAGAAVVLALAAWSTRLGWLAAPEWILAAWVTIVTIVTVSLYLARRAIAALGPWHIGASLEDAGAWRRGALTTVLDAPAIGTSAALHAAAAEAHALEVTRRGPAALRPALLRQRRHSRQAAAVLAVALGGLLAARPATGAPAKIWNPVGAWRALVAPVRLSARSGTVARGERVVLDLAAVGHRRATLYTRAPGESWRTQDVTLDADGLASITTAPLAADLVARVEAGGRVSPDVHVAVRLAAFLGTFTATAHYPSYLGLEDEALPTSGDTLVLPEGTRLTLNGRATTSLANVRIAGPGGDTPLTVSGATFHGEISPRESGVWRLQVTPANGGTLEGEPPTVPMRIVLDSAPAVEIPVPGVDTIASPSMSLALVVSVRDDHGIASAAIESRRGATGPMTRTALPLTQGPSDRALITTTIDLGALGLKAGDTLRYVATAQDNAPARHVGRSREFVVRIPTEAEQRAARTRETAQTATSFDSLAKQAARVQRTEEDLAKERQRADPKAGNARPEDGQRDPLASDAARKADAVAQAQQKVIDDATKLQKAVQELRDAAEKEGAADSALTRELNEINKLLDKALSPELRDKLAALKEAVKALDADRTRASLQDLAKQQAALKDAMDQARELFKKAALETDLANMGQDAKQLATEQKDLTQKLGTADSGKAAKAEHDLAKRADSLATALERAADQVPAQQPKQGLQQAGKQARDAADKMRGAAKSSEAGKPEEAQQQGKQAEDQLNPLSKNIEDNRKDIQAEMRAEVMQALERALQETARLAKRQFDVAEAFQRGSQLSQTRLNEGLIEEGAGKLAQQLAAVSAMNALVSPQAAVAIAEARKGMREAIDAAAAASPNVREAVEKSGDAVDALAVAAFSLMQSKDKVNGSQSGSGVQEAMEQMKEMAGKQGQMAQQGAGMMQGGATAQQVMQMAMQQRALAQQLERMRAAGQLPGAGQMAREAKDLSKSLEGGRLNQEVVDRQQKLFKRMLDAGRTLQGEEDDDKKERQSTTAKDGGVVAPAALDPRIRNGAGEIRLPSWESLQRLSPEERRRVVDYFQKLTQGGGS